MLAEQTLQKTKTAEAINPSKIMQIGMGFWASKVMLTAVKLQLFTHLAKHSMFTKDIKQKLGLNCSDRHVYDWLDCLVSLGFLERKGLMENAQYSNTAETDIFLDKNKPTYMGGILEMANNRLYNHWNFLEDGLRTGTQQNEARNKSNGNMDFFADLYKDENALREFVNAMSGVQMGNFIALANKFDFSSYNTMLDVGGADGCLCIQVCQRYPNIKCTTLDLPAVEPLAKAKINTSKMADRIKFMSADFMKDKLPQADVICMGNILHGLDEQGKRMLMHKVYNTLPVHGAFVAIENIIDNDRRENTFGMLMSLNMLIENGNAFDYTLNDFEQWAKDAGFTSVELIPLAGPTSAAVAYK